MPEHKTKSHGLLDKIDSNKIEIGKYAKVYTDTSLWCNLCQKSVAVDHGGLSQVNQHAKTKEHKLKSASRFSMSQPRFEKVGSSVEYSIKPLGTRVFEAECLWAFKVAEEDWSFTSCDSLGILFQRMFPGEVSGKFSMAHTKMSYVVRHGLSEVLLVELVDDVNNSVGTMTLLLDETTTAQVKKQCDFLVRYWSEKEDQVVTRYLTSTFFAHTSANEMQKMVFDILELCDVSTDKFANLSTDGPNLNKGLYQRLDQKLREDLHHGLLPWNPCVLHKVHTGFHKGLLEYGKDLENLAFDLHGWFKIAPCKREDFMQVAVDFQNEVIFAIFKRNEALFYRHVECRWLTLVPALKKVEERWSQAKKYFLDFLPTTDKFETTTGQNKRYKRIVECLNNEKAYLVQLAFVIDVCTPFSDFLLEFQSEGPKVHIIYHSMKEMLLVLMRRFIKSDVVNGLSGKDLQKVDVKKSENQLKLESIEVGAKTKRLLQEFSLFDQKKERKKMLKFFESCATFLQKKLPLDNMILVAASSLHPDSRKMPKTIKQVEYLTKKFPHVIEEANVSQLKDEWKFYQAEDDSKVVVVQKERVDHYWRKVFKITNSSGALKYVILPKLVKSVLSLQNANADVERSLSDNKNTCTKDRVNLMPETLIGLRRMKEYARSKGGSHCVVVSDKMIEGMASAKRKDDERILQEQKALEEIKSKLKKDEEKEKEKELMIKEAAKSKKKLEKKEQAFQEEEEKVDEDVQIAQRILEDATSSLKCALQKMDMVGIKAATELVESSSKKLNETAAKMEHQAKVRAALGEKRKNTIDNMFAKIKKAKKLDK